MKVNQLLGCNALKEKKMQKVTSDERVKTSHKLRTYSGISMNLGPIRTRRIFIYFVQISLISSILQVRTLVLIPTKCCQTLPNLKSAVVLPQRRTNFGQMKIW